MLYFPKKNQNSLILQIVHSNGRLKILEKKLINNTFQSKSSEAMVIWQDSDLTGNNIKVLTICKPLGSVKWNFVRIDVLDDYKYDDINYDNFGIAEYDIAQDYLGYYTKNNKILIFGLAIDEASGMAKKR